MSPWSSADSFPKKKLAIVEMTGYSPTMLKILLLLVALDFTVWVQAGLDQPGTEQSALLPGGYKLPGEPVVHLEEEPPEQELPQGNLSWSRAEWIRSLRPRRYPWDEFDLGRTLSLLTHELLVSGLPLQPERGFPEFGSRVEMIDETQTPEVVSADLIWASPEYMDKVLARARLCDSLERERDALRARVAELEEAQRWIPVGESLPGEGVEVEVIRCGKVRIACHQGRYGWRRSHDGYPLDLVTHYRPMPASPE